MSLSATSALAVDGDAAFLRVNSRKPAHALAPGEAAAALNTRFDDGKAQPRFGVTLERWGRPLANLIAGTPKTSWASDDSFTPTWRGRVRTINGFTVGRRYRFILRDEGTTLSTAYTGYEGTGTVYSETTTFTATQGSYYLISVVQSDELPPTEYLSIIMREAAVLGYQRFSDPYGTDNAVLLLDDWRDGGGEDGGRGRAYRICPGNAPQEIDLNGHDLWDTCRMAQAHHTLVMARHGIERHYFAADAVDAAADTIQLNCAPHWADGEPVLYVAEADSEILPGPNPNAVYYVKTGATNLVTLHGSAATALAGTSPIDLGTSATGRFYLQRAAQTPGFFGIGAPSLILQPTDTLTAFENGWRSAPATVAITDTTAAATGPDRDSITAPNHGLLPGDGFTATGVTGLTGTKYACPISDHALRAYDTAANALAGGATGLLDLTVDDQTGTLTKLNASSLPMPPLRELVYYKGRIIGINGRDTLVISDPFDFLHYQIFNGLVPANLGESGQANWLLPLGEDALLIGKDLAILGITGLSGASSGWAMDDVTREYGGIAPMGALNVGSDAWFASRKGLASVVRTVAGEKLGVARPVSRDIPGELVDVDWLAADRMACASWNNRFFWAVPVKGQERGAERNNRVLVYNFLNQGAEVRQTVENGTVIGEVVEGAGTQDSWEGAWTGMMLAPYAWARLKVNGDERLTFATADGLVCWFTDGFTDDEKPIDTSLTTRGYFGGAKVLTLRGEINWDTHNPEVTVQARTAGYKENATIFSGRTMDRTKYELDGAVDYDPDTSTAETFEAPHRRDYSLAPSELLAGELDIFQNQTQPIRLRVRDRAPQVTITNAQGAIKVNSVQLEARPLASSKGAQT